MQQETSNPELFAQMRLSESDENHDSEAASVNQRVPDVSSDRKEEIIFEPLERNPYEMSYTCLLLPRFGSDYLSGDVAVCLEARLKRICASFEWNLEFISIEPSYLHWTIRVPPATSTAHIIQVIRDQTSLQLFADFPRFKRNSQPNDFWAPGYLIFWGSQPHPIAVIQRFILQTRQQQGILMDE